MDREHTSGSVRWAGSRAATRPLRVLCIKDRIADTGGTAYFLRTLPLLDPERVQPTMCGLRPWHPIGKRFEAAGIPTRFLERSKWDPRGFNDVRRLMREYAPDVVHLEGRKTLLVGRVAARQLGRPAIAHFHDMLPLSRPMRALQRRLASSTAKALAVSQAVRDFVVREFAIPPERVDVLYNGLDVDRLQEPDADARARIRRELEIDDATPVIGLVGRVITAVKGQDVMLRAMRGVLARRPDAVLALVGDGPDLKSCRVLAADLGIEHATRFMGHRDDVPDVLAAIDVAAVPSMCDEAFSFVALEALAAGRPVVAFRSGGIPEIVQHAVSGIIVAKGDEAGLAHGSARLLEDDDLRRCMAANGRKRAHDFTMDRHIAKLTAVYEAAATAHPTYGGRPAIGSPAREPHDGEAWSPSAKT
jgi:glycosyltransferase involved in cell wall biosynthesis